MGRLWNSPAKVRPAFARADILAASLSFALSSCALDAPSNLNIKIPDMTAASRSRQAVAGNFFSLQTGAQSLYNPPGTSTPPDAYSFSCYGVVVLAPDLPQLCGGNNSSPPYHGGLVPATGGSVSLKVPVGSGRNVRLFGIVSAMSPLCPSLDDLLKLNAQNQTQGTQNTGLLGQMGLSEPYDLGGKVVDIFSDAAVSITPTLNASNPVALGQNCGSGAGGGYSPPTFPGLNLWVRGDSIPSGTANGTVLGSWQDGSYNAFVGSITAAAVDNTTLSGGRYSMSFNGGAYVTFGINNGLTTPVVNRVISGVVYIPSGAAGTIYSENFISGASAQSSRLLNLDFSSGFPEAQIYDSTGVSNSMVWGSIPSAGWHVVTMIWANTNLNICVDGICMAGVAIGSPPSPTTSNATYIGAQNYSSMMNFFNGKVAELTIYNSPLSQSDLGHLECYFKGKYPNDLPNLGHPCP